LDNGPRRSISPDWFTRGHRPVPGQFGRRGEAVDVADLGGGREPGDPADPRGAHQQRDVAMIGPGAAQPALDLTDPPLEIVDQLEARLDVPAPRLGEVQLGEQPAAGDAEQVGHRDLMPERDQRGVDPVLEDRAVLDQMQPPPASAPARRAAPARATRSPAPDRGTTAPPGPAHRPCRSCTPAAPGP
jgi:hypothetical protein